MSDQLNAGATSDTAQTWKTIHTRHTLIHSNKANMNNDYGDQMIIGDLVSIHLSYRWGKNMKKTSHRKLVPTGDRTRARSVTGDHATACSTAVDMFLYINEIYYLDSFIGLDFTPSWIYYTTCCSFRLALHRWSPEFVSWSLRVMYVIWGSILD